MKFNKNLENDVNAIYRPLKNQTKGNIEALKDELGNFQTSLKKVPEMHAKELTKKISNKELINFRFEESGEELERVQDTTVQGTLNNEENKGEEEEITLNNFNITHKYVQEAIKEMKSSISKDSNDISKEMINPKKTMGGGGIKTWSIWRLPLAR